MDNDKYAYYKSAGYNFFCNVDGSQEYWVQIRDQYVRQGRINLDGYSLYKATQGGMEFLKKMFDPMDVSIPEDPHLSLQTARVNFSSIIFQTVLALLSKQVYT